MDTLTKPIEPDVASIKPHLLPLLFWPADREPLHTMCSNITQFGGWTEQLALDLFTTMKHHNGIGLAAPQCGLLVRAFTIWVEEAKPIFIANPKILETSDEMYEWEEGCLSVPGVFENRKRPQHIVVEFNDTTGKRREFEFHTLYAFAFQHEMEHLDGKLFVDHVSSLKQNRMKTKVTKTLKKMKQQQSFEEAKVPPLSSMN